MDQFDFFCSVALADNIADYQDAVVPFCSKAFSVTNILAIRFHRHGFPEVLFCWIPDEDLRTVFNEGYEKLGFMLDPYFQRAFVVTDWEASRLKEIAPDRFEASEYFTRYFGATKMVDEVGFVARIDENTAVHLSMGRNLGQRRFRASEVAQFKLYAKVLAPKLRQIQPNTPITSQADAVPLDQRFYAMSQSRGTDISMRQAEVAALIVQGHSSRAIGLKLCISIHTVKVHRRSLYKKLEISSQNELFSLLVNSVSIEG
ncbi:helix-turn-helix transcriptional regulator [Cognatishimia sp. MH4019]|uniref:helix-turn-helix transcriptional regulator n=1 Tax=Cognatishimia sp. MH4019 TaxID=2854030 RepID=UPI001CD68939|nr:helix-turn-helix transcriptional regulator [Cognatishimia sp. MH4019]